MYVSFRSATSFFFIITVLKYLNQFICEYAYVSLIFLND